MNHYHYYHSIINTYLYTEAQSAMELHANMNEHLPNLVAGELHQS